MIAADDFDEDFCWGVGSSAYQSEGAYTADGKGLSIWDVFTRTAAKDAYGGDVACDFYNRYMQDLMLMQYMNISHFRFSLSWSRIMPEGFGRVNEEGIHFYNRLIDFCLELGIQPWITLYHWDLPYALELRGGWTTRSIVDWFNEYVRVCVSRFGDRVKHWAVLHEPLVFTGAGYLLGLHAPGKKGLSNFLPAVHHAALCQASGLNIIRSQPGLKAGAIFNYCQVVPATTDERDVDAAQSVDVLINRLFPELLLGAGYPAGDLKPLAHLHQLMHTGDEEAMKAEVDFIAVHTYQRETVRYSRSAPYLQARFIKGAQRNEYGSGMLPQQGSDGLHHMLQLYASYPGVKKIYVTPNGAVLGGEQTDGKLHDPQRIFTLQAQLASILSARRAGAPIAGYFAPAFTDQCAWSEGFSKRSGLVHVDYATQRRAIKASGHWFRSFLRPRAADAFQNKMAV